MCVCVREIENKLGDLSRDKGLFSLCGLEAVLCA